MYHERILEYLNGNLTAKQVKELRKILREEGIDLSQLDEMEKLVQQLDEIQAPEPQEEMRDQFYQMLEEEKSRIASKQWFFDALIKPVRFLLETISLSKMAYASLFLMLGIILGHWIIPDKQLRSQTSIMMEEMQNMKKMMALTLFDQSNASDRLKAVSFTSELTIPDDRVLEALLKTLNNDPNVNVRLASLDALTRQIENPEVRTGLVQSISNQDSPLVQVAIAGLMIKIHEKSSVPELEKLLQRENLNEVVAEKVTESLKVLI